MSIVGPDHGGDGVAVALTPAVLKLLSDPAAYQAKLDELDRVKKETAAIVAMVGPAQEIMALRDKANADTAAARLALEQAKMDAERTVSEARNSASQLMAAAEANLKELEGEAVLVRKQMQDERNAVSAAQAEVAAELHKLDDWILEVEFKRGEVEKREAALKGQKDYVERKLTGINEKIAAFQAALGSL